MQNAKALILMVLLVLVTILSSCDLVDEITNEVFGSGYDSEDSSYTDSYDSDDYYGYSDNYTDGTVGMLKTSDGSPLAGASVVIASSSSGSYLKKAVKDGMGKMVKLSTYTDDDGSSCADLSTVTEGVVVAADCTDEDGRYHITAEIPCGEELTFYAVKGSFSLSFNFTAQCVDKDVTYMDDYIFDMDCGIRETSEAEADDEGKCQKICHIPQNNEANAHTICVSENAVDAHLAQGDTLGACEGDDVEDETRDISKDRYEVTDESCDFEIAKVAVVTGYYDEMENVLAKLGYGYVDSYGELDRSMPQAFTLIDGDDSLSDASHDNFNAFVSDVDNLTPYDIIFINCGNAYESISTNSQVKANLQQYVEEGGKLYVTDWSYMFLEQSFPEFMDFFGGGDDWDVPETPYDIAKEGVGGIDSRATINNKTMSAWLDNVYVNDGSVEDDCYYLSDSKINKKRGARNADGTVTIGDFLGGWVVMEDVHDETGSDTTVWVSGPIETYYGDDSNAPLTASRDIGDGRILYSSYHTAHSCPTTGFWPQERILQYLVFEL